MTILHRRQVMMTTLGAVALAAFATNVMPVHAQDKSATIGIELPLTGADADSATRIKNGALMAIDDVNAANSAGGYKIKVSGLDNGPITARQSESAPAS